MDADERATFNSLALFAKALFDNGLLDLFPPTANSTKIDSVILANEEMLGEELFVPEELSVKDSEFNCTLSNIICNYNGSNFAISFSASFTNNIAGKKIHYFIYDFVKGIILAHNSTNITNLNPFNSTGISASLPAPNNFNAQGGSLMSDCIFVAFSTDNGQNNTRIVSATFTANVN